jgi:hypothetical protein
VSSRAQYSAAAIQAIRDDYKGEVKHLRGEVEGLAERTAQAMVATHEHTKALVAEVRQEIADAVDRLHVLRRDDERLAYSHRAAALGRERRLRLHVLLLWVAITLSSSGAVVWLVAR